jgi:DNA-binding HxlR family transcriptional regulator
MLFSPWADVDARIRSLGSRGIQTDTGLDAPAPVRPEACPVEELLALLGHRWNALILWHLQRGPMRHGELKNVLPRITSKVLSGRLGELRVGGLVIHETCGGRYQLTPKGRSLLQALNGLEQWAKQDHDSSVGAQGER